MANDLISEFNNMLWNVSEAFQKVVAVNEGLTYSLSQQAAQQSEKGPNRPNRKKLTPLEVKDIRIAFRGGMKQKDLADNYGVNPATISRTVRGIYH